MAAPGDGRGPRSGVVVGAAPPTGGHPELTGGDDRAEVSPAPGEADAYIGLGSNLGDRAGEIERAFGEIEAAARDQRRARGPRCTPSAPLDAAGAST